MSTPSDPADSCGVEGPEAVLVRTPTTDPIATFDAASVGRDRGTVLAVLASVPEAWFERRLSEAGYDSENVRVVDFVPSAEPTEAAVPGDGGRIHGDIAGLSMELVGRLEETAEGDGVVYFDSLEPYVSVAGLESTFRFLVIVVARARAAGVPVVARLDPDAVDSVAAGTLAEAFDRVVEGPSGESADDTDGDTDTDDTDDTAG